MELLIELLAVKAEKTRKASWDKQRGLLTRDDLVMIVEAFLLLDEAVKYPHVKVKLVGQDGNSFAILGRTTGAMKKAGISKEEIDAFSAEARKGDYNHLLQTVMKTVTTEDDDAEADEDDEKDDHKDGKK